jgi:hypothetical protein
MTQKQRIFHYYLRSVIAVFLIFYCYFYLETEGVLTGKESSKLLLLTVLIPPLLSVLFCLILDIDNEKP